MPRQFWNSNDVRDDRERNSLKQSKLFGYPRGQRLASTDFTNVQASIALQVDHGKSASITDVTDSVSDPSHRCRTPVTERYGQMVYHVQSAAP
jgi:hypothetical protein